jgi:hypothetical protein
MIKYKLENMSDGRQGCCFICSRGFANASDEFLHGLSPGVFLEAQHRAAAKSASGLQKSHASSTTYRESAQSAEWNRASRSFCSSVGAIFCPAFSQMPSKKGTGSETAYSFFTAFSS